VVWAVTWAANPVLMCRDAVMGPGDVCANADGTATQTYEQRYATWQSARPVVGAVGGLVAGFGLTLAGLDTRSRRLARA